MPAELCDVCCSLPTPPCAAAALPGVLEHFIFSSSYLGTVPRPRSKERRAHTSHLLVWSHPSLAGGSGSPICSISRLWSSGMDTAVTSPDLQLQELSLFCFGLGQPEAFCPFEWKSPKQMHEMVSDGRQVKQKSFSYVWLLQGSTWKRLKVKETRCVQCLKLGVTGWRQQARTCPHPCFVGITNVAQGWGLYKQKGVI